MWIALLLTITASGATLKPDGTFDNEFACRHYEAAQRLPRNQSIGCVHADQLDMITDMVWKRRAKDIWK